MALYGYDHCSSKHTGVVVDVLPGGRITSIGGNYGNTVKKVGSFNPSSPGGMHTNDNIIVCQMLAGVPVWGRVLWIATVVGGLAAVSLNGDGFTTPEFSTLYGLMLALGSVLVAWTRLRQIPPASRTERGVR